jgi:lysozyme
VRHLALLLLAACAADPVADSPELGELEQTMSVCADGPTVYGIDVSRFQGTIDWQKVKNSGVVYAYIQISRSLTDIDAKFPFNWQRAKEVGILRGAYQRFHPGQDVAGQANLFLQKLGPYEAGDLPPMLDVEDADGLSGPVIAERVREWMDIVEPAIGMKPLIYTGFYFWRDQVGGADFSEHPLWIANYGATCPLVPQAWTRWAFHQYSSSAVIPGITENTVDVNKFNGTLEDLEALAAQCGDGTCNGAEDAESCPVECEPCQMIAAGDGIGPGDIIDESSSCFRAGGDPQFIRTENAGYGSSLKWTHATDAATPSNFGQWNLHFAEAGRYRIEAFTPSPFNQSRSTIYQVEHAGVATDLPVDQSAVDGWNLVGELDFAAGGGQSIRVDDNTGEPNSTNTQIVFDALRFTRITDQGSGSGSGDGDGDDLESSSGCATGGGSGGWLAGLLLALAIRRRRS